MAAMHRVIFFALVNGQITYDDADERIVERILETADLEEAQRLFRETVLATGFFSSASLHPNPDAFAEDDLAGYLRALNTDARLCAEYPREGTWIPGLTEDLTHWAASGITSPEALATYLDDCVAREMRKSAF